MMNPQKRQYIGSTGKRKSAVARVKVYPEGAGDIQVNAMSVKDYFSGIQGENAMSPLVLTEQKGLLDVEAWVRGGGKSAQADAVRHGISRALIVINPELRTTLKAAGYLRRDARIKERKKPGLKRARRAPQWQKR